MNLINNLLKIKDVPLCFTITRDLKTKQIKFNQLQPINVISTVHSDRMLFRGAQMLAGIGT